MKVYVATVPTKYETMAVALTEAEAVRLASEWAYQYLSDVGAKTYHTDTPQKVLDYLGSNVTEVELGSATFAG